MAEIKTSDKIITQVQAQARMSHRNLNTDCILHVIEHAHLIADYNTSYSECFCSLFAVIISESHAINQHNIG